ncbi:MAG: carbamoyl-phosphate synthase large subunit, partial [Eubacteriales bacterium]
MPIDKSIKKVLVIGSGPIVIGQAAEFDYAGAQACRVLKEAGVNVVLINSNPATIMTDKEMADEIYLEPLTEITLERIIEKERPDSLLAGLGGQAGLTLATKLWESGFLKSHGVKLIGTNVEAIEKAEDRQKFKDAMRDINIPTIPSGIAGDVKKSLAIAEEIGYPVIIRPAYTLGGAGGGVAENPDELKRAALIGLDASLICQILVEKYIYGWKEIEFEVMRDRAGNCIAVCSMENIDPVGVHTGDSIVVAPALTLSPKEYLMLKDASLKIIESLGIYGGCNCQFALDPESLDFAVIEVNPRVSRSSALASKATCYPIAKVTTKIALGLNLDEITNDMTGKGSLCFEPALDYVVVKLPKWPFDKFTAASRKLGTQMKATGEVMALATSFEAALLKAVRGAEISLETLGAKPLDSRPVRKRLEDRDDRRIFTIFEALKAGVSVDEINKITRIDRFFINSLKKLCDFESRLRVNGLDETSLALGKAYGYTDSSLREISGEVKIKATPAVYKAVDNGETSGGRARYFYSAYGGECESRKIKRWGKDIVIVLGSGPIRIGQGIEFD